MVTTRTGQAPQELTFTDVPLDSSLLIDCPACGQAALAEMKQKMLCPRCRYVEPCCEGGPA